MDRKDIELRDLYAAFAMQAFLEHDLREYGVSDEDDMTEISEAAFNMANCMMKRRAEVVIKGEE